MKKLKKLSVTIVPVQKQSDGYNCGLFSIAFATDVLNGLSPVDSCFDVSLMRSHLLQCLETEELAVFPKTSKRIRSKCQKFKFQRTKQVDILLTTMLPYKCKYLLVQSHKQKH